MSSQLSAKVRTGKSRSVIHKLRSEGQVPASVYGKRIEAGESIAVTEKELTSILRKNPYAVIELSVADKGKYPVMINEIQRDKLSGKVLHVDFHQISMDEPVKSTVGIDLAGEAPGVREGGILSIETYEVEVRCLPAKLPAQLSIDISGLHVGDNLLVSDLQIPDDVELLSEPTGVIVTILAPQKEVVDEPEESAAEEPAAEE